MVFDATGEVANLVSRRQLREQSEVTAKSLVRTLRREKTQFRRRLNVRTEPQLSRSKLKVKLWRSKVKSQRSVFASITATAFAGLFALATTVPAASFVVKGESDAGQRAVLVAVAKFDPQSVQISSAIPKTDVDREAYSAQSAQELAAAAGIKTEATFTNNPNGTIQWPFPVGVHIGDGFGYRSCEGCSTNHQGQDFNPGYGAPIQVITDGVVVESTDQGDSLGVLVAIEHKINGQKIVSVYAHMIAGSRLVSVGDVVKVGQVIGQTGSTGQSTGAHLHLEIRLGGLNGTRIDPLAWLYAHTN